MPHLLSSYMMLVKCLTARLNGLTTHALTHSCNTPLKSATFFRTHTQTQLTPSLSISNYPSMCMSVYFILSFILTLVIGCIIYLVAKARPAWWQKYNKMRSHSRSLDYVLCQTVDEIQATINQAYSIFDSVKCGVEEKKSTVSYHVMWWLQLLLLHFMDEIWWNGWIVCCCVKIVSRWFGSFSLQSSILLTTDKAKKIDSNKMPYVNSLVLVCVCDVSYKL